VRTRTTYKAIQDGIERLESRVAQLELVMRRSRTIIQETQVLLNFADQTLSAACGPLPQGAASTALMAETRRAASYGQECDGEQT
jgi:hypothetical protein